MKTVSLINHIIALLFAACYFYQFLYIFVPFVKKAGRLKPETSQICCSHCCQE